MPKPNIFVVTFCKILINPVKNFVDNLNDINIMLCLVIIIK